MCIFDGMEREDNDERSNGSNTKITTPRGSAAAALVRFFSFDSDKSDKVYGFEWNPTPEFRYGFFSKEFLIKFLQLVS